MKFNITMDLIIFKSIPIKGVANLVVDYLTDPPILPYLKELENGLYLLNNQLLCVYHYSNNIKNIGTGEILRIKRKIIKIPNTHMDYKFCKWRIIRA